MSRVGTTVTLWRDAVAIATYNDTSGVAPFSGTQAPLQLGRPLDAWSNGGTYSGATAQFGTTFNRVYGEDLTVSGNTAQAVMSAEYALNSATF